jgi:SAM-dependent methyltransferase
VRLASRPQNRAVTSTYGLGTNGAEQAERERLAYVERYHDAFTIDCLEKVGVTAGWRCADVGAGAGSIASWLRDRVGEHGEVVAIDLDTSLLKPLVARGVVVRDQDVTAGPIHEQALDLIHARLLLVHLPARERVLRKFVSAVRPGGIVLVGDIDFTAFEALDPGPAWVAAWDTFLLAVEHAGWDVACGKHLAGLLARGGLEDVRAEARHGAYRGGEIPCELLARTFERLRERLLAMDLPSQDLDSAVGELRSSEHRFLAPGVWTAWGHRPRAAQEHAA